MAATPLRSRAPVKQQLPAHGIFEFFGDCLGRAI
jgi:hypothetical protein